MLLVLLTVGAIAFSPEIIKFILPEDGIKIPSFGFLSFPKAYSCRIDPVFYRIENVDQGFGVSADVFAKAIEEAEGVWESAVGRDIFISRKDDGDNNNIAFNLVFDERQTETILLKGLFEGIGSEENQFEEVKKEYDLLAKELIPLEEEIKKLNEQYEILREDLLASVSLYNAKKKDYEDAVAFWNERGGAPKKEYNKLVKEKDDVDILYRQIVSKEARLKTLRNDLEEKISAYNELAGRINTLGGILNRMAASLNADVSSYNRIQADREEFVTGSYEVEGGNKSINVYQFYDYRELVIIIAHEMGHALGVDHALNENSIMYPKITYQEAKLSAEDINLIMKVCANR